MVGNDRRLPARQSRFQSTVQSVSPVHESSAVQSPGITLTQLARPQHAAQTFHAHAHEILYKQRVRDTRYVTSSSTSYWGDTTVRDTRRHWNVTRPPGPPYVTDAQLTMA